MKTHICLDSRRWKVSAEELFFPVDDSEAGVTAGRGKAVFFRRNGKEFVRKHYERGGWVRRLVRDRYGYTGLERTRMWREYRLLKELGERGLPVPEPVAARCVCHRPFHYSGDLVTVRLAGAETLGAVLRRKPLSEETWRDIGATLARFHRHHVYHADLNIENIMLGRRSGVALIDFDKGAIRPDGRRIWIRQNMQRLLRSLRKASLNTETFYFSMKDWCCVTERHEQCLRDG